MPGFHKKDLDEVLIICKECNGYLWSESIYDVPSHEDGVKLIKCPYKNGGIECQPKSSLRRN